MFSGWPPMQPTFFQPPLPGPLPMISVQPPGMAGMVGGPMSQPPPPGPGAMAFVPGAAPPTGGMPPPPGDEPPPLPPEPPPPEENAPAQQKELKPKDPLEEQKLQNLKNQAAYWQQAKQMQEQGAASWAQWPPTSAPPPVMALQPPVNPMEAIQREEVEFNLQYSQWKKQYNEWREQNKSHPNREQFQQYLQQWQMYESQMEEKKGDIQRRKGAIEKQMTQASAPSHGLPHGLFPLSAAGPPAASLGTSGPSAGPPGFGPRFSVHRGFQGAGPRFGDPRSRFAGPSVSTPTNAGHEIVPPGTEIKGQEAMQLDEDVEADTLEELFNSEGIQVNKIMLSQLSQYAKDLINEVNSLGPEGKQILKAFCTMNPAQLNRMVIMINMLGTEVKAMSEKGLRVTEHTYKRMRKQIMDEMVQLRIKLESKPPDANTDNPVPGQGPRPRFGAPQRFPGPPGNQPGPRGGQFPGNSFGGTRLDSKQQSDEWPNEEEDGQDSGGQFDNHSRNMPPGPRFSGPRGPRPLFGGPDQGQRFGEPEQGPRFGGSDNRPRFGGPDSAPRFGGPDQRQRFPGPGQGPRFGGSDQGSRFGGSDQGSRFGGPRQRGPAPNSGNKGPVSLLSLSFDDDRPPGVKEDSTGVGLNNSSGNKAPVSLLSLSFGDDRPPGVKVKEDLMGVGLDNRSKDVPPYSGGVRSQGSRAPLNQPRLTGQRPGLGARGFSHNTPQGQPRMPAPQVFQGEVFEPPPKEEEPPGEDKPTSTPSSTASSSASTVSDTATTQAGTNKSADSKTDNKLDLKVTADSNNKDQQDKNKDSPKDKNTDSEEIVSKDAGEDVKGDTKEIAGREDEKKSIDSDTKTDSKDVDTKAEPTDAAASTVTIPQTSKPSGAVNVGSKQEDKTEDENQHQFVYDMQPGFDQRRGVDENRSRQNSHQQQDQHERDRQQRGQFGQRGQHGQRGQFGQFGRGRGGNQPGDDRPYNRDRSAHRDDSWQNQREHDRYGRGARNGGNSYNRNKAFGEEYDANAGYDENAAYDENAGYDESAGYDETEENAGYDENAGFDENTGYDANQDAGYEKYGEGEGYGEGEYRQEEVFGQDEQFGQRRYGDGADYSRGRGRGHMDKGRGHMDKRFRPEPAYDREGGGYGQNKPFNVDNRDPYARPPGDPLGRYPDPYRDPLFDDRANPYQGRDPYRRDEPFYDRRPIDAPRRPMDDPRRPIDDTRRPMDDPRRPIDDPRRLIDDPRRLIDDPRRVIDDPRRLIDDPRRLIDDPRRLIDDPRRPIIDDPMRPIDDPYRPIDDPFRRGYDDLYQDPYMDRPPVTERVQFKPAETIDYGHKPSASARDSPKPFQAPAVIDYGHGQAVDDRSHQSTPEVKGVNTSSRGFKSSIFDHQSINLTSDEEKQWDRPGPPPMDSNYPSPYMEKSRPTPPGPPPGPPPKQEKPRETCKVEDVLCLPGRANRPSQIVVIVRGLPGSGKTYISKLIKDKEVSSGGSAPRMLCLDDYFMIEVDRIEKDPETGRRVKAKVLEYEYEAEMESAYRQNMLKSFKKTIDDGFFPFIIVDAVFDRVRHFEEFWSYAKSKGFQVYVAEMQAEVSVCAKRNTHKRTQREIERLNHKWEKTPRHYIILDMRYLLQEDSITEVEMEDLDGEPMATEKPPPEPVEEEDDDANGHFRKSRWEVDISEEKLDKLDGLQKKPHHVDQSMEEFLQLADEYFAKQIQEPGRKRVRWADLEERKNQSYRRDLGFVVGQTQRDWERITDPSFAERQLNRTKYF